MNYGSKEFLPQEVQNLNSNKTNINKTDSIKYSNLISSDNTDIFKKIPTETINDTDKIRYDKLDTIENFINKNINYEYLKKNYENTKNLDTLNEIRNILVDVIASNKNENDEITIAKSKKPYSIVKSTFSKLNENHIQYVIDTLNSNSTKIGNMKQYLLTCLYNSSLTMNTNYSQKANYDLKNF